MSHHASQPGKNQGTEADGHREEPEKRPFAMIAEDVLDGRFGDLAPDEALLLIRIILYARGKGKTDTTIPQFAKAMRCSDRTVQRHLGELQRLGIVRREGAWIVIADGVCIRPGSAPGAVTNLSPPPVRTVTPRASKVSPPPVTKLAPSLNALPLKGVDTSEKGTGPKILSFQRQRPEPEPSSKPATIARVEPPAPEAPRPVEPPPKPPAPIQAEPPAKKPANRAAVDLAGMRAAMADDPILAGFVGGIGASPPKKGPRVTGMSAREMLDAREAGHFIADRTIADAFVRELDDFKSFNFWQKAVVEHPPKKLREALDKADQPGVIRRAAIAAGVILGRLSG